MEFPPSLSDDVLIQAFHASNGELSILPADADLFLTAYERDHVELLGWDLWLIDHADEPDSGEPVRSPSSWCGLIPSLDSRNRILGGEGDRGQTRSHIRATELELPQSVDARWMPSTSLWLTSALAA
jgi:hypothetical protein